MEILLSYKLPQTIDQDTFNNSFFYAINQLTGI